MINDNRVIRLARVQLITGAKRTTQLDKDWIGFIYCFIACYIVSYGEKWKFSYWLLFWEFWVITLGRTSRGSAPTEWTIMAVVRGELHTGFRDNSVLKELPGETQVLIFTGNFIPEVPQRKRHTPRQRRAWRSWTCPTTKSRCLRTTEFSMISHILKTFLWGKLLEGDKF